MRRTFLTIAICVGLATFIGMTPGDNSRDPRNEDLQVHLNPHNVVGYDSCEKCHGAEVSVWKQTPHHDTFLTLHRRPEAKKIADAMGISSFKEDSECIKCHYTMKSHGDDLDAISGVSCESCHGAAKDWLTVHNDYGGENITRDTESADHRTQRLLDSIAGGMRNPVNVYLVARSCYRCHTVPSERLVNVGGHNEGSLDFEIVSWSQGTVRHNFIRSAGKQNAPSDRARIRKMFVSGMIADLEFSLRATASATEKAAFGVNAAKRASRASKRLAAAQRKINDDSLGEILSVFAGVKLKLNNYDQLIEAADSIAALGVRFAATADGAALEAIDKYIPAESKWK